MEKDHKFIYSLIVEGDNLCNNGDFKGAISCYDTILAQYPDETTTLFSKAQALYYLRRDDESLELFLKVLNMDNKDQDSYIQTLLLVSQIMLRKGRNDEAMQYINKVLEIDPENQYARGYKVSIELNMSPGI